MTTTYGPSTYGDDFADVYDDWYSDVSDVAATVKLVTQLVKQASNPDNTTGRVLELGVGTGRLALAIAAKGVSIDGIDSSTAILERLAEKDPLQTVGRLLGDIGATDFGAEHYGAGQHVAPGPYQVVFAAYNTFFNLTSEQAQLCCLKLVAQRLAADGKLLIEVFLPVPTEPTEPADRTGSPTQDQPAAAAEAGWPQVEVRRQGQSLLLNVSVLDAEQQLVRGRHIEVSGSNRSLANIVNIRSWQIRYLSPSQLDELAIQAGFELENRWADWHRNPFDATGTQHVSVYRLV